MGDIPTPRSYPQILGDLIDAFRSKQGIKTLKVGSGVLSTLEAAAQGDLRGSQDTFDLLTAISIDDAEGLALERHGRDENVPKIRQSAATGSVDISDASFVKKSTKLFQGAPAPIVGSVTINVVDASDWPASGQVYLGRGTANYEGPLSYSSKSDAGTHWTLTLSAGTTKFHNTSETAILAQGGNRVIGANTIVRTPQANVADAVEFRTLYSRTIADGETFIGSVPVVAQKLGVIGNVGKGQIKEFSTEPFTGATVTNPRPFSNGTETESDDDYRERIKAAKKSRALGTSLAIRTFVTGITAADENKRVSSTSFVKRAGLASTLYIDDGTGYEERVAGVAVESLVDSAIGGEQYLEANQRPIARAFAITTNVAPYALSAGAVLTVKVGGVTYVHGFDVRDFTSIENATAYEVCASINANPDLAFLARTSDAGTKVVLFAKVDVNEDIEVVASEGVDANLAFAFPPGVNYTLQLYKNDRLLTKDGTSAQFTSQNFSVWDALSGSQTLTIAVDGTPEVTYTFVDQDFIDAETGFTAVGRNSIAAWVEVFNSKIPGITATEAAGRLTLTSNRGPSARAGIAISGGSLVSGRMFASGSVVGSARDYTVDRNESQIVLEHPLAAGDRLSVGTLAPRAFLESGDIGTATLSQTAKLWFVVDGSAEVIPHGVTGASTFNIAVSALRDWGHLLTITATSGTPFVNVAAGDWLILWDPALNFSLQGAFRVASSTSSSVTIERRLGRTLRGGHRSVSLAPVGSALCKILTTGGSPFTFTSLDSVPSGATNTCEIYDPTIKTTVAAAPMNVARTLHTATLLANGKVFVAGGLDSAGTPLSSCEIYDPTTDTWTMSGDTLPVARCCHTATLLANGKVLIAGGGDGDPATGGSGTTASAYLYTPGTDSIAVTGSMPTSRQFHRAIRLPSGDVLIAGGQVGGDSTPTNAVEIYSVGGGTFSATASMAVGRRNFGLALIGTSPTSVLAVGNAIGLSGKNTYQVYSIGGGSWGAQTTIPNNFLFEEKDAITRTDGKVLLLHGKNSNTGLAASAEFDGTTWTARTSDALADDVISKFGAQYVTIQKADLSIANRVAAIGGYVEPKGAWGFMPTAQLEEVTAGLTWLVPDAGVATGVALTNVGLAVVRTSGVVHEADVPSGTNYTATSVVAVLNPLLPGATATVYRTNRLRVTTNTFAQGGDIALVTQDQNASGLKLSAGSAIENLAGHVGAVESANSEIGTPSFDALRVRGLAKAVTSLQEAVVVKTPASGTNAGYGIVGLRDLWSGGDGTSSYAPAANFYRRSGSNLGARSRIRAASDSAYSSLITPRSAPVRPWAPLDRLFLAAPYALGPNDDLTVMVDNDITKRFSIKMYRKLQSVGSTYSSTNTFRDADAGGVSLAQTFGLDYDFDDFAVYMAARAIAFPATANTRSLFRYNRLGPDGNGVRVRFANPLAPLAPVSVALTYGDNATTDVRVRLAGGAARTVTVHAGTKVGALMSGTTGPDMGLLTYVLNLHITGAARTSNVTTITVSMPAGATDHGLNVSDAVWVQSTDSNFSSGLKTITARTSSTIQYAETAADATGAAIGTVSFDSLGEATFAGSGIIAGDYLRINNPAGSWFDNAYTNNTVYITAVSLAGGHITTSSGDNPASSFDGINTTVRWATLGAVANLQVFANASQAANTIASAVNALEAVDNSTVPITMKTLGAGTGTIVRSTPEELDDASAWYTLADGVNWVATTASPGSISGDYSLTFKNPITGALATTSDWPNEEVHLVPTSAPNIVAWLNTPTVSGLFTTCLVQASSDGSKVQIATRTPGSAGGVQVQGGLASSVTAPIAGALKPLGSYSQTASSTVRTSDTNGLSAGMWCKIANENTIPKTGIFGSGSSLVSWDSNGVMHLALATAYTETVTPAQSKVQFERQGRFVAIVDTGLSGAGSYGSVAPGSFVRITPAGSPTGGMPQVASANQGIFRVVRAIGDNESNGTIWIENANAIEECAECTLAVYDPNSVLPGDELLISTPIFGVDNQGRWVVEQVGSPSGLTADEYTDPTYLKVSVVDRTPVVQGASATLDTSSSLVQVVEGTPATFVLRIDGIAPNQTDGSFSDIKWDRMIGGSTINESAGSVLTALDKLGFAADFVSGTDGYHYDTGLLGEANRVVYGDPSDTSTYPGVAAAGAVINIQGPLVKRVTLSLSLRIRSGVPNSDVADRVRSAVATVVNQTPIGTPISLSDVVAAASRVRGVVTVAVISPSYNAGNDRIPVQPFEKPLILNIDQDIQISFTGS